ncbi:mitochondrial Homoaconitase [Aspergillus fumigatus]
MGSPDAKAYLASPEVVAASALNWCCQRAWHLQAPRRLTGVSIGEGEVVESGSRIDTTLEAMEKFIGQLDSMIDSSSKAVMPEESTGSGATEVDIAPASLRRLRVKYSSLMLTTSALMAFTLDDVTKDKMAQVWAWEKSRPCLQRHCPRRRHLRLRLNFGCGSSREQAATSILEKQGPLVVAGSIGNTFSRNAVNNAPLLEMPRLIERLREAFGKRKSNQLVARAGPSPGTCALPRSLSRKAPGGETWSQSVPAFPPNPQDIIAQGGLEKWVKKEISGA